MNKIRRLIRRLIRRETRSGLWECIEDCYHTSFRFTKGSVYRMMEIDLPRDEAGNLAHFRMIEPDRLGRGNISPHR